MTANLNFFEAPLLRDDSALQTRARAVRIINVFRVLLSLIFFFFYFYVGQFNWSAFGNTELPFRLIIVYSFFSVGLLTTYFSKRTLGYAFHPFPIIVDIIFILLMMHAAGGIQSGIGLLLIITIVTASLVSNGRLALFYAAIATIGLLLEQSYQIIQSDYPLVTYTQSAMLSLSCFATAWLAYSLAKRVLKSEELASARGIDLENLAQVNALITREMQDGVMVIDQDLTIRHYNHQSQLLLNWAEDDQSHLNLGTSFPPIYQLMKQWMLGLNNDSEVMLTLNNRTLKLRFESVSPSHRQYGVVIFIQDWSQIQATAQQTKLAALGRLTANIAHEIRNPLSAISHANQLLQEEESSAPNLRILQIVADNIQRIDQIIKDVLELNRRDRTQQEMINLPQFISDFYTQFCAVEKVPLTHFQLQLPVAASHVRFDQRHLTQILWNLCKNGWEHSQQKECSLTLKIIEAREYLNVIVHDDGEGVPEANRVKLFEPFYTTKRSGSGLGLYISRELAEANGAFLYYQALGQGGTFVLQLKPLD